MKKYKKTFSISALLLFSEAAFASTTIVYITPLSNKTKVFAY